MEENLIHPTNIQRYVISVKLNGGQESKKEDKMKLKEVYKLFSLSVGVSAILVLVFFLITDWGKCIIPFEPNNFIRITEIVCGLISFPYYFNEMFVKVWREE